MDYKFERQEPIGNKILFVLSLDKAKMKERILIGEEQQIRFKLSGDESADVMYDEIRPAGTFITDFVHDEDRKWNQYGLMQLYQALESNRWKQPDLEHTASNFLSEEFSSGDPVKMYVTFRIWNEYLIAREYRERESAKERFLNRMSGLVVAFHTQKPLEFDTMTGKAVLFDISKRHWKTIPEDHLRLDLWYPDQTQKAECVAAFHSFYPLLIYYMNRISDWGLHFCKCKVCGKIFLAKSLKYELCSDKCRKKQALQNKREFDERARENNYDREYKNECQHWLNQIHKYEKSADFSADHLQKLKDEFSAFKKEALQKKKLVKQKQASSSEFSSWLAMKHNYILDILNGAI